MTRKFAGYDELRYPKKIQVLKDKGEYPPEMERLQSIHYLLGEALEQGWRVLIDRSNLSLPIDVNLETIIDLLVSCSLLIREYNKKIDDPSVKRMPGRKSNPGLRFMEWQKSSIQSKNFPEITGDYYDAVTHQYGSAMLDPLHNPHQVVISTQPEQIKIDCSRSSLRIIRAITGMFVSLKNGTSARKAVMAFAAETKILKSSKKFEDWKRTKSQKHWWRRQQRR